MRIHRGRIGYCAHAFDGHRACACGRKVRRADRMVRYTRRDADIRAICDLRNQYEGWPLRLFAQPSSAHDASRRSRHDPGANERSQSVWRPHCGGWGVLCYSKWGHLLFHTRIRAYLSVFMSIALYSCVTPSDTKEYTRRRVSRPVDTTVRFDTIRIRSEYTHHTRIDLTAVSTPPYAHEHVAIRCDTRARNIPTTAPG